MKVKAKTKKRYSVSIRITFNDGAAPYTLEDVIEGYTMDEAMDNREDVDDAINEKLEKNAVTEMSLQVTLL